MELRAELMPPTLAEEQVARLATIASELDGFVGTEDERQSLVQRFNQEAGTAFAFRDFQGIYGGTDHDTWTRGILSLPAARQLPDISRDELIELVSRIQGAEGEEHEVNFWLNLLEANVPDPQVSDLIFWPDQYFDREDAPDLTAAEIVDIALTYKPTPLAAPETDATA